MPFVIQSIQSVLSDDGDYSLQIIQAAPEGWILQRRFVTESITNSESANPSSESSPLFLQIQNFLDKHDHNLMIDYCSRQQDRFESAAISGGQDGYRKALTIKEDPFVRFNLLPKISKIAPIAAKILEIDENLSSHVDHIECRITAHEDRGYFHIHNDNGSPEASSRRLTFVYYFRSSTTSFYGGELKIYRPMFSNRAEYFGDRFVLVYPVDNSIVFFNSSLGHEVLPTYVPSKRFSDSRFTVNGWFKVQ